MNLMRLIFWHDIDGRWSASSHAKGIVCVFVAELDGAIKDSFAGL